ncbi:hypothetical protein [Lunatibacter salilacus]|uniref:hypothetical protein n=1 Tax=Lunatibacter salilacus TaxID=2483804 RepID=UPI00131DDA92|nr:hypothetical protein [Lunatibacter salilacus]
MTTSFSGITAYTGGLFPEPFGKKAVFTAESVSNLVHVDLTNVKGMILSETSSAINLQISPGVEKELNRKEIKSLSLMPPLAGELTLQEMSDLIAFIKQVG